MELVCHCFFDNRFFQQKMVETKYCRMKKGFIQKVCVEKRDMNIYFSNLILTKMRNLMDHYLIYLWVWLFQYLCCCLHVSIQKKDICCLSLACFLTMLADYSLAIELKESQVKPYQKLGQAWGPSLLTRFPVTFGSDNVKRCSD